MIFCFERNFRFSPSSVWIKEVFPMKQRMLSLLSALLLCLALPAQAEIRFEHAAFDGQEVQVNLSIASETTPVYIILDQIALGGLPFDENSSDFADG